MYVLLYTNAVGHPCYGQGTLAEINADIRIQCGLGNIDREDWEFSGPFEFLCIEDGKLTPVNSWEMTNIPQFWVN
jgi:hypothetical protein